jgi:prepilin-type N-terminal cleavage/methylation domain-containing protein
VHGASATHVFYSYKQITNIINVNKHQKGFTLIELLIVIGIIAVLIGVFVTTINLARPFQQARDAQRSANVNSIATAAKSRLANYRGSWNATGGCAALPTSATNIGSPSAAGVYNLGACLIPAFMTAVPYDPSVGTTASTGYTIYQQADGRINVSAPLYEGDTAIGVIN